MVMVMVADYTHGELVAGDLSVLALRDRRASVEMHVDAGRMITTGLLEPIARFKFQGRADPSGSTRDEWLHLNHAIGAGIIQ